jgi:hypothetical protein
VLDTVGVVLGDDVEDDVVVDETVVGILVVEVDVEIVDVVVKDVVKEDELVGVVVLVVDVVLLQSISTHCPFSFSTRPSGQAHCSKHSLVVKLLHSL